MARYMASGDEKLYRAVIVRENVNGDMVKTVYGPYEHKRTAGFVLSYMTDSWWGKTFADKYIEETQTQWYRV